MKRKSGIIPMSERDPEYRREMGRRGGLAKAANARRKAQDAETLDAILSDPERRKDFIDKFLSAYGG